MRDSPNLEFLALQEALAGRYSLERELGRGGMGIVYLAREVMLDRPVALKLLPAQYAAQRELRERFLREARTAARLSHPNIVPIHAVDEVRDFVFMVMAYIEGQTLEQRIRERGPLPAAEGSRILREVAWALAYAHAQNVVHRDIKPANILLEAGSGRALVSDFGIAHVSGAPALTGAREIIGTAEFMSPEQASGDPVDGRSDIYALGVVGYFMLSGRLPFEGDTVAATLAKQITQSPAPLSAVAPEMPSQLSQTIDRCLAKAPDARFAGGEQLADALGRSLERRTEVPLALRLFSERVERTARPMVGLGLLALSWLGVAVAFFGSIELPTGFVPVSFILGTLMAATPLGMLVHMARRLLRAGHGHDELVRALRVQIEERREALASEQAPPGKWDRFIWRFGLGSFAFNMSGLAYMILGGPYFPAFESIVLPIMNLSAVGYLSAGLYLGAKNMMREKKPGAFALRFWNSRIGRALFKIAGIKLEQRSAVGAAYRPTELAIAMAADRLFEALPREIQQSLPELPLVVKTLEAHAEKMRARIAELAVLMNDIEPEAIGARGQNVVDLRDNLAGDLRAARTAAEQRLADVVTALETIRLQLLRMQAGVGSVERMTADLSAAQDVAHDVELLLEGELQVGEVLGIDRPRERGDTPVPV